MFSELIYANESVINALGWTLIHSVWQISLITLILFVFLRSNKSSAATRYNVLAGTILLIPVAALITFLFYFENTKDTIPTDYVYLPFSEINLKESSASTLTEEIANAVNNYSSLVVTLWFTGILLLLIRFAGGLFYTNKLRKSGVIPVNPEISSIVNHLRSLTGITRQIKIFESILVKVPVTIGYLKPLILLPAGTVAGIPPSQLEAILAHEIAHIKRWDYLHNLINTLIEIIFFYHPAIWWITDRINQERENCCDDIAITITGDSAGLARALAGLNQTFYHPQHILAMTGKQNHLLERIKRLAGIKESNSRKLSYHGYSFLIITALAAGIAISVHASIQLPDNFLKTSHSVTANNLIDMDNEEIIQDTLKTKKKQLPQPKKAIQRESTADSVEKKKELSDAERAKIESEMEKLSAEMRKLEMQMEELNKQLGNEWRDFDFDFNFEFDTDSMILKINEDLEKEMAHVRVYTDKALRESHAQALKERAISKEHLAKARAEAKAAGKNMIIIEKEIAAGEKSKAKAKRLKMKAESNQLEEELKKDGLITGEHFSLKLDNTGMYLDGKKLSEDHYRKYRKLVMSDFEDEDEKYLEDKKFNIIITK